MTTAASTGSSIPRLEEALEILDGKELRSCAASLGVRLTSSATNASLMQSIIKHAKTNQSIKSHFSSRRFTVADVVLNQLSSQVCLFGD